VFGVVTVLVLIVAYHAPNEYEEKGPVKTRLFA
jgi:hypothetical protein